MAKVDLDRFLRNKGPNKPMLGGGPTSDDLLRVSALNVVMQDVRSILEILQKRDAARLDRLRAKVRWFSEQDLADLTAFVDDVARDPRSASAKWPVAREALYRLEGWHSSFIREFESSARR